MHLTPTVTHLCRMLSSTPGAMENLLQRSGQLVLTQVLGILTASRQLVWLALSAITTLRSSSKICLNKKAFFTKVICL